MGSLLFSLICISSAFASGIEIARRHPDNPWSYVRTKLKNKYDSLIDMTKDDGITDVEEIPTPDVQED